MNTRLTKFSGLELQAEEVYLHSPRSSGLYKVPIVNFMPVYRTYSIAFFLAVGVTEGIFRNKI
jgi:hypothetical protein